MSRLFFTEYFKFSLPARDEEVLTSIRNNLKVFDNVFVAYEFDACPVEGVINVPIGQRGTFRKLFELANENSQPGDIVVISNSDIYFDETLDNLGQLTPKDCVSLTRYEDGKLFAGDPKGSQDTWIFSSPIRIPKQCDFYFGVPGCDNHILYLLKKEVGYHVENFCLDVKSHHLHSTAYRTGTVKDRVGHNLVYEYSEPRPMKHREPSSFCTIATINCIDEFVAHVCSLNHWHPGVPIYAIVDTETKTLVRQWLPFVKNLFMFPKLDGKTRAQVGAWKGKAMNIVLAKEKDVLYLDSDILVLHKLFVDPSYEVGLSPRMIRKEYTDKYGYYNGGMVWTRVSTACDDWMYQTLEELSKNYSTFEFDQSYNVSWWRVIQSDTPPDLNPRGGPCVGKVLIKCVNTHFASREYSYFNNVIVNILCACNRHFEISLIKRILNKHWDGMCPQSG
jgi:hypothetical protein